MKNLTATEVLMRKVATEEGMKKLAPQGLMKILPRTDPE